MHDPPTLEDLIAGCAAEAKALADEARAGGGAGTRQRLLVLAHTLSLAGRELAAGDAPPATGDADAAALAAAIRRGEHDADLADLAARLRADVARRLQVAHPGYDAPA